MVLRIVEPLRIYAIPTTGSVQVSKNLTQIKAYNLLFFYVKPSRVTGRFYLSQVGLQPGMHQMDHQ